MTPAWSGGGAIDSVSMTGYVPAGLPYRYEPGTPHIVGAASVLAALQYIQYVGGYSTIAAYEDTLVQYMCERIRTSSMYQSGDMVLIGSVSPQARIGVFSFHFPRYHVADIADTLAEDDICVRTGRHCTDPLHDSGHIPATLRVSLYMYSTTGDIDRFFARLEEIVNRE
jgi:cysteine desulfurase/selenocysteine lyase